MPWVRFLAPFDFTPAEDRRITIAYPAGYVGNVRTACAKAAVAAKRAQRIRTPSRGRPDGLDRA